VDDLIHTPKHADLIYDVGMHHGEDTEFYLRKGFRVVGIEADAENAAWCRRRFAECSNQGQLTIVEGAIIDGQAVRAGQNRVAFYKNETQPVWGTVRIEWAQRNERGGASSRVIEVATINFEDTIQEHGIPYYMKVDIEGSDIICLNALARFSERPDYVSIESAKTSFSSIKHEIKLLSDLGYDSFQAVEQSELSVRQSPPCPPREGKYVAHRFEPGSSGLFGAELGDAWKSKREILRLYRLIRMGYGLVGDDGVMRRWNVRGAWRLQSGVQRLLRLLTHAAVPGWFDTHARHALAAKRPPHSA
jgi:FkbM family methyltransferase